jgi:endogenous inhibitor of DNA gyrase (YacG/DUF329 family)
MAIQQPEGAKPPADTDILRHVRCPGCGGHSLYAPSNPARPFCSERCKNMDFGAWASESFRVPAPPTEEDLDLDGNTLQ